MKMAMIAAAAILTGIAGAAHAQSFDGATIQYQFRFPDLNTPLATQTAVVGPGVEFVDAADFYTVDLGGNAITITDDYGGGNSPTDFNGIVLSDVSNNLAAITGVTFTGGGFDGESPLLSFDADNIYFNFANITQDTTPGTTYSYAVTFDNAGGGDVPEPASWAMMITGFGLVGATARRRSARMVQAI